MRWALICAAVLAGAVAFGGYIWVTKHERISQDSVQSQVQERQAAKRVLCSERTANGSIWWCAGFVKKAGTCWVAHVSVRGKVTIADGGNRCTEDDALAALMGQSSRIDKATLQKGLTAAQSAKRVVCVSRNAIDSVWWCAGVVKRKGACWLVRVPTADHQLKVRPGKNRCRHVPALRRVIRSARA